MGNNTCSYSVLGSTHINNVIAAILEKGRREKRQERGLQEQKNLEAQQALTKAFAQLELSAERGKINLCLMRSDPELPEGYTGWVNDDGETVTVETPSGDELEFTWPAML
ncbi:MAG: hypothetical protein ABII13_01195 [Patescibacteria group bacterium]